MKGFLAQLAAAGVESTDRKLLGKDGTRKRHEFSVISNFIKLRSFPGSCPLSHSPFCGGLSYYCLQIIIIIYYYCLYICL